MYIMSGLSESRINLLLKLEMIISKAMVLYLERCLWVNYYFNIRGISQSYLLNAKIIEYETT